MTSESIKMSVAGGRWRDQAKPHWPAPDSPYISIGVVVAELQFFHHEDVPPESFWMPLVTLVEGVGYSSMSDLDQWQHELLRLIRHLFCSPIEVCLTGFFALLAGLEGRIVGVKHVPELVASSTENINKSAAAPRLNDGSLANHIAGHSINLEVQSMSMGFPFSL